MTVLVVIGIVLGALWLLLMGVVGILRGIGNALGRRQLYVKASIPVELESNSFSLHPKALRNDKDYSALFSYKPIATFVAIPRPPEFTSLIDKYLESERRTGLTIFLEDIPKLLEVSPRPPYEQLADVLNEGSAFPESPPRQREITPPPSWSPERLSIPEPTFSPPYYPGPLRFLNSYVRAAYQSEFTRVSAAQLKRDQLEDAVETRNRAVNDAAVGAQARWQHAVSEQNRQYADSMAEYKKLSHAYTTVHLREKQKAKEINERWLQAGKEGLLYRIELMTKTIEWPHVISRENQTTFDPESGIVIHEYKFPDLGALDWKKFVLDKNNRPTPKPANQKEIRVASARVFPSLCLRLASEIARIDTENVVKAIAVNGFADYTDKATGQRKRAYCASLFATAEQIQALRLSELDPIAAFNHLKGVTAQTLEITPIAPIVRLDRNDPRFVDSKEILSKLAQGDNLAAMDWEDFEHLCRELFERAFGGTGVEVKVTQASRDQGVDAIIFDPDPIRGGKFVVQAKRYTNTVDVSAVRDLYGAIINEGANRGILVTTSHFGSDSYSFAKDKPITLLNGNELLGLLEQHGYKFRIDLAEAKQMLA